MTARTQSSRLPSGLAGVRALLGSLAWPLAFGIAYTQAPLFFSNQHQYFLHGLAQAGLGDLKSDWLANTEDPTPVFSTLVTLTWRHGHGSIFYLYYLAILGLYFRCMLALFEWLAPVSPSRVGRWLFATLLIAMHAGIVRWLSVRVLGVDYPAYLQSGVAGQYILRFGLQPSVAGVFLLAGLVAFLHERPFRSAAWIALAAAFHPTYLLTGGLMVFAFMVWLVQEKQFKKACITGGLALILVLPVLIDSWRRFRPTTPESFAEAQRLLAHFRIPHHTEPGVWLDLIALLQLGWVGLGLLMARRAPLRFHVAVVWGMSLVLTLAQVILGSDSLALLFPWRVTVILVPIATTIVLARLAILFEPSLQGLSDANSLRIRALCSVVIACLVAGGIAVSVLGLGYHTNKSEESMLDFVKAHRAHGEVYLIPVSIPERKPGVQGAAVTDFTAPPRATTAAHLIAVDLQRFRLYTGAPIYVDFKSVPYKDTDVVEWHNRLLWAKSLYDQRDWDQGKTIDELRRRKITHVVAPIDRDVRSRRLKEIYRDKFYAVYRVDP